MSRYKGWIKKILYHKSPIKLPGGGGGAYLFQAHLRGGGGWGLNRDGGLFERRNLFNLETTMVSVRHKELECKVEKLKYKKL